MMNTVDMDGLCLSFLSWSHGLCMDGLVEPACICRWPLGNGDRYSTCVVVMGWRLASDVKTYCQSGTESSVLCVLVWKFCSMLEWVYEIKRERDRGICLHPGSSKAKISRLDEASHATVW